MSAEKDLHTYEEGKAWTRQYLGSHGGSDRSAQAGCPGRMEGMGSMRSLCPIVSSRRSRVGKGACGGLQGKVSKEKKKVSKEETKPQPSNSSKNTCVLYALQTELLLQGLTLRICVAQDGSPDLGKQLLQLWQGLGPSVGQDPQPKGLPCPLGTG